MKCNFRVMGKKFGKLMKAVSSAIDGLSQTDITRLEADGFLQLNVGDSEVVVERGDVEIISENIPGWTVANDGSLTVALDLDITDELRYEGLAREIIKRIQTYRKEKGFEITDHIRIKIGESDILRNVVRRFEEYICSQVLADSLEVGAFETSEIFDLEQIQMKITITKS